jgi:phosphatidylinositol alpha-mannosyltransferase
MRIALFHTTLPEANRKLGGVEVAVHVLANELARLGDDVTVLSLGPLPADALYEHRRLFKSSPWLQGKLVRLTIVPILLNFVDFKRFDLVHLHGDDWFFVRRGVPTVRTLHGSALREAQFATSLKRKVAQHLVFPLERVSSRLATVAVAVGADAASLHNLTDIVDNGVDLDVFRPGSQKSPRPTVLFVGTHQGRKRGEFLFETFVREVLPALPDAELRMVTDSCPSHPRVVDLGHPGVERLAREYRQAWVFAYPSVYEGFGMVYLEALASGTAIVSSPNPGADHVLEGGRWGRIVEDRFFGQELVSILVDHEERSRMELRGRLRAQRFSWTEVAARLRSIYHRAIDISSGRLRPVG